MAHLWRISSFFAMLKYQNGYSEDWIVPIHFSRSLDQGSISPPLSTALGRKQRWKGFIRAARVKGMPSATEIEDGFKFYHPPGILPINIDPENSSVLVETHLPNFPKPYESDRVYVNLPEDSPLGELWTASCTSWRQLVFARSLPIHCMYIYNYTHISTVCNGM